MKTIVIKKEDLRHNINKIKEHAMTNENDDNGNSVKIIAVVKGNGYGLGLIQYVKFLMDEGIDFFAVATVEEALKIREAGIKNRVLMLSSIAIKEDVKKLVEQNVIITLGSEDAVKVAEEVASELNTEVKAHLKIDTGFGRYGFRYENREKMVEVLKNAKNIKIEGTFTHFSMAFYDEKYTKLQFNRFIDCIEVLKMNEINPGMLHVCNSSAFIRFPNMHLNAVRIGSAFLGRLIIPNTLGLKRIGYLESQVSEIKDLPKGSFIGYGNTYKSKKDMKIAIIPCGYMDGVNMQVGKDMFRFIDKARYLFGDLKSLFKRQSLTVEVAGKICNIVGTVGTYHVAVDVTNEQINVGDIAVFKLYPGYVDSSIARKYR